MNYEELSDREIEAKASQSRLQGKHEIDYESLSDREIDKLVAERVFGKSIIRVPDFIKSILYVDASIYNPKSATIEGILKGYSTNISDAWLVVEEMRKRAIGESVSYWDFRLNSRHNGYNCFMRVKINYDEEACTGENLIGKAQAKSAPRAICIAALKALGEK